MSHGAYVKGLALYLSSYHYFYRAPWLESAQTCHYELAANCRQAAHWQQNVCAPGQVKAAHDKVSTLGRLYMVMVAITKTGGLLRRALAPRTITTCGMDRLDSGARARIQPRAQVAPPTCGLEPSDLLQLAAVSGMAAVRASAGTVYRPLWRTSHKLLRNVTSAAWDNVLFDKLKQKHRNICETHTLSPTRTTFILDDFPVSTSCRLFGRNAGREVVLWLDYSPPTLANRVRLVTPVFSHVGIVPDDAAGRRVFSGIFLPPGPSILALLHTHRLSRSSMGGGDQLLRSRKKRFQCNIWTLLGVCQVRSNIESISAGEKRSFTRPNTVAKEAEWTAVAGEYSHEFSDLKIGSIGGHSEGRTNFSCRNELKDTPIYDLSNPHGCSRVT
ncbi:hypothetical protein PR048_024811 [Dryococelus australis]|uniref:Uncharacterized protein n=1 Tax=Dryococelus australis TaxID=614101 RepID=A0ABQ9GPM6_9NEOP|nr:hypothetical protein PR048_024811 [Dryococelus australis]